MHDVMPRPVRYDPGVEAPAPDEAETIAGIIDAFTRRSETVTRNERHAVRIGEDGVMEHVWTIAGLAERLECRSLERLGVGLER